MHLYLAIRGQQKYVDDWRNDWSAQYFPYKYNKGCKKYPHTKEQLKKIMPFINADKPVPLQCIIRPISLYELVFPKESLDEVLRTMFKTNANIKSSLLKGLTRKAMAKILQSKPIPDFDEKGQIRIVRDTDVSIYPIGIKPDAESEWGESI